MVKLFSYIMILRSLWVTLGTSNEVDVAGTNTTFHLEFRKNNKSIPIPADDAVNENERGQSMTYIFNVNELRTEDFEPGTVVLRNDNTGRGPGWKCASLLIIGIGEDGKYYLLVAMNRVNRWLAANKPEGLTLLLDIMKSTEVGIPSHH